MNIDVDLDLVRKYDRPGPRYTSYPTAPHFSDSHQLPEWEAAIKANNETADRDLSLYFHLPFCDTLCWFCGCTTVISRKREPVKIYVDYLIREIDLYAARIHKDRKVVQIHFGGGTPTHLSPDEIRRVGEHIHSSFNVSSTAEISCEMDPRGLTREHVAALHDVGFNRASVGIQDFNPVVQQAINRIHDEELVGQVIQWIREFGFTSLNLDLIYGLPHQSAESFMQTIETVRDFRPDRLAVFSYAHVPWIKPHQKLIKTEDMPQPEEKLVMLKHIVESLTRGGFEYIGMDHFARLDDDLTVAQKNGTLQRNFQGYSTHAGTDIYGMGMSSISQLPRHYSQHTKDIPAYYNAVDDEQLPVVKGVELSQEDVDRRFIIMRLMCDMSIDFSSIGGALGYEFERRHIDELIALKPFEEDGLLKFSSSGLEITPSGRLFVRNIAMVFDAYLEKGHARYSRTV